MRVGDILGERDWRGLRKLVGVGGWGLGGLGGRGLRW